MAFEPHPAPATPYPDGAAGIRKSVNEVAAAMRDGRLDPDLRAWAIDCLTAAGLDGRNNPPARAQVDVLLAAMHKQTIYVPDPKGAEWIQKPHVTLCLRDRCIPGGDCDDLTAALGGACLAIGLNAYAVKIFYGAEHQEHILIGFIADDGSHFYADLSTNKPTMTVVPHAVDEEWVDPLDQASKATGTVAAELVTLGRPMKRELYYRGGHWFEFRYGQWWLHDGQRWLPGPVERQAKGLPGVGRPYKHNGAIWQEVNGAHVEVGLGTIFGWHTVSELKDLYNALTFQADQIAASYGQAGNLWQAANRAEYDAWTASYTAALAAWNKAVAEAQSVLASNLTVSPNYTLALTADGDDDFDKLAAAFQPFEALDRQLRQATAFPPASLPTYTATPQPTSPDLDLFAYQIADNAWQKTKQIGSAIQDRLERAAPYLAIAATAVGIYAIYRVSEALPRRAR